MGIQQVHIKLHWVSNPLPILGSEGGWREKVFSPCWSPSSSLHMVDHSINKQCTEPLFWACERLGTHHSLREQSAGTLVIKLALPGVHLVPSVLKGADGGAGIAKWSGETGKNRCQPRGQGPWSPPCGWRNTCSEEGVDCPSCSRRGRKLGRRGGRGSRPLR